MRQNQAQAPVKERTKATAAKGNGKCAHLRVLDPMEEVAPALPSYHAVRCLRCVVGYRESHYHCCLCRRVFRSA